MLWERNFLCCPLTADFRIFAEKFDMKGFIVKCLAMAAVLTVMTGCRDNGHGSRLDAGEKALMEGEGLMRVLLVTSPEDSAVLRRKSIDLRPADLKSELYGRLVRRMVLTVSDSTQDGVGLAAPQVGLNRRVVAVMRYDKPGYPFEVYPNIYVEYCSEQKRTGPEGCLSVPDIYGEVERSERIVVRYTDPESLTVVRDTVEGYTAVIFQHEVDHLEGILFTDRLKNLP